jgi:hypothetical protein
MYGWIWRRLPGGNPARKGLAAAALAVATVAMLWFWVFPAVEPHVPIDQGTVQIGPSPSLSASAARSPSRSTAASPSPRSKASSRAPRPAESSGPRR